MSLKALPLVFINLGGEMMYIIDQRLTAQKIPEDKARKVIFEILNTMMNQDFLEELFKPQELYSRIAMKTLFDKLAHSSIMKLNTTSMDKLYDLMTVVFKYQVYMCPCPGDLLFITLNHLDGIRQLSTKHAFTLQCLDVCCSKLLKHCASMTDGEMQIVRYTILNFFQDLTVKVSVFLKEGIQSSTGKFRLDTNGHVPSRNCVPGKIIEYNSKGDVKRETSFDTTEEYKDPLPGGSIEVSGNRGTKLGCNIYENYASEENSADSSYLNDVKQDEKKESQLPSDELQDKEPQDRQAQEELQLLARLIGCSAASTPQFTLNLFSTDEEETRKTPHLKNSEVGVVEIDISKGQKPIELSKIMSDFTFDEVSEHTDDSETQDLLDLLDSTH